MDHRITKMAEVLVGYSVALRPGETVYVEAFDVPTPVLEALLEQIHRADAIPLISQKSFRLLRKCLLYASGESMRSAGHIELERMKKADAYIGIKAPVNITEYADIPALQWDLYHRFWWEPVHIKRRLSQTRWVTLRWPTAAMAQQAGMSTESFEDLYFKSCTMDYQALSIAMEPLRRLMEKTGKVHITGPGTDISFSIKGIPAIKCDGHLNLPDGEVSTAPVMGSTEGEISFNVPMTYQGNVLNHITLEFHQGNVVNFSASDNQTLDSILAVDQGARCVGEFALGVNPIIRRPMHDILFDEKISGSLHLALGNAYPQADNGNRSRIHADMVLLQNPGWGGGTVYFDGVQISKDGKFVIEELNSLNPDSSTAFAS